MPRAAIIVAAVLFAASLRAAQTESGQSGKSEKKNENTRLTVQVLSETTRQPVANAQVVVRFTEERLLRRDKRVSWQAKTNRQGVVVLPNVPVGNVKVQIIAKGFQTYGDQHELAKPQENLTILLAPPKDQVSAY